MNDASEDTVQGDTQSRETPEAAVQKIGKVESKTPGRMRVRVKGELRTPDNMARLESGLNAHPNVGQVTINQRTGSIAFTHSKDKDAHDIFAAVVQEATLLAEVALEIPGDDGDGGEPADKLNQQLADLMYRVDTAIYEKTGLRARGRVLPATIAGLGVAQLLVYGISLETLPGPVLIWIGWDIYHRFGKEPSMPARAEQPADGDSAENVSGAAAAT